MTDSVAFGPQSESPEFGLRGLKFAGLFLRKLIRPVKTPRSGARGGMTQTAGSLTACLGLVVGGSLGFPVPS